MSRPGFVYGLFAAGVLASSSTPALYAQVTPNQEPLPVNPSQAGVEELTLLPGEDLSLMLDEPLADPSGSAQKFRLKLAPTPIEPVLPSTAGGFGDSDSLASALRVRVKKVRIEGNRVFSTRTLHKLVAGLEGREVTSAELEAARQALTLYYVERGFINSGVILPDQDLVDGVIVFQATEGQLTDIELKGNRWFRPWYLRSELRNYAGRPLNLNGLKEGLQLLRQNPNITQVNAELMPGGRPGESILKVDVKERQPFRAHLDFSNRRPPSVGAEILELSVVDLNLTGHDDPLALRYGIAHTTAETLDRWQGSGTENIEGSYQFPITPWRTTLEVRASKNDSSIVEEQFRALEITSETKQYSATLRQPFYESLNNEFAVSLTAEKRESATFLLDRPFTLSPGAVDGETKVFVLRLALEFTNRSQQHVLALRSTFSAGLNDFDATRHASARPGDGPRKVPDGQFFAWLGQGQYVRRLFDTDNLAVVRLNAQFANDPLLSLEQYSLGGAQSVRGYRENLLLRDNGVFASIEVRVPVVRNKAKEPIVLVAPFVDWGIGWDRTEFRGPEPLDRLDDRQESLASAGLGVIFSPTRYVSGQIYWGYGFHRDATVRDGENLQDYGLHFALSISAF